MVLVTCGYMGRWLEDDDDACCCVIAGYGGISTVGCVYEVFKGDEGLRSV